MNFIESLIFIDTKEFINEISKELELNEELEEELLKTILIILVGGCLWEMAILIFLVVYQVVIIF